MPHAGLALVPLQEGQAVQKLPASGSLTIGRKASCDLVIAEAHAYVSGAHCRISVTEEPGAVALEDLSANGTFVNGNRLGRNKTITARIGDEVSLAKPTRKGGAIRFRIAEAAPEADASPVVVRASASEPDPVPAPAPPPERAASSAPSPAPGLAAAGGADGLCEGPPAAPPAPPARSATMPPRLGAVAGLGSGCLAAAGGGSAGPGGAVCPEASALAEALARERQREREELGRALARGEEEAARLQRLEAEVREARLQRGEEREQRRPGEAPFRGWSDPALAAGNARSARECEELRERLARVREESAQLERDIPAREEETSRQRRDCLRLQAEVDAEQECARQVEVESATLRNEVEEVTERALAARSELALATQRNARLEEECAEAAASSAQAQASVAAAQKRLATRNATLATLRGAVQEHARAVSERLRRLECSLQEVQADSGEVDEATTAAGLHHGLSAEVEASIELSRTISACGGVPDEGDKAEADGPEAPCGAEDPTINLAGRAAEERQQEGDVLPSPHSGRPGRGGHTGVAVKVDSSMDDETPTQDADAAAGAAPDAGRGAPLAKRRRLPSSSGRAAEDRAPAASGTLHSGAEGNRSGLDGSPL